MLCALLLADRALRYFLLPAFLVLVFILNQRQVQVPKRLQAAQQIERSTEPGSFVISAIDPVYLTAMAPAQPPRFFIPIDRKVEYASKLVAKSAPECLPEPPQDLGQHRFEALKACGLEEALELVALEDPDQIKTLLDQTKLVYLDGSFVSQADFRDLRHHFELSKTAENIYLLSKLKTSGN